MTTTYNAEKFKELILYVADQSFADPSFGATKLNKLLFFSDFLAYQDLGEPVTGATYQRLPHGPAPRELLPALRELEAEGRAQRIERAHFNRQQKRVMPLDEPDLSHFSAEEISLVDSVLSALRNANAMEASNLSHRLSVGWQIAGDRQEIPYESVFLSSDPPSPGDIDRGLELAKEHGWLAAV